MAAAEVQIPGVQVQFFSAEEPVLVSKDFIEQCLLQGEEIRELGRRSVELEPRKSYIRFQPLTSMDRYYELGLQEKQRQIDMLKAQVEFLQTEKRLLRRDVAALQGRLSGFHEDFQKLKAGHQRDVEALQEESGRQAQEILQLQDENHRQAQDILHMQDEYRQEMNALYLEIESLRVENRQQLLENGVLRREIDQQQSLHRLEINSIQEKLATMQEQLDSQGRENFRDINQVRAIVKRQVGSLAKFFKYKG